MTAIETPAGDVETTRPPWRNLPPHGVNVMPCAECGQMLNMDDLVDLPPRPGWACVRRVGCAWCAGLLR